MPAFTNPWAASFQLIVTFAFKENVQDLIRHRNTNFQEQVSCASAGFVVSRFFIFPPKEVSFFGISEFTQQ
jgi:hypothetical protein